MNPELTHLLMERRLSSAKRESLLNDKIADQQSFDELFTIIFHHEKQLAMRAASAIDKLTKRRPEFLAPHQEQLLKLLTTNDHHEIKWHIAELLSRTPMTQATLVHVWHVLSHWALNPNEGKNLRAHALQSLHDLSQLHAQLKPAFHEILTSLKTDHTPILHARVQKFMQGA